MKPTTMDSIDKDKWVVIGISGVTCGGKTTLANKLLKSVTPCHVLHQDKYFYPDDSPKHIRCESLEHNDYDVLSALDMEQMYRDALAIMRGKGTAHVSSEASAGTLQLAGRSVLVVEGFTVLNCQPLHALCSLRYYVVLSYGDCRARRCMRLYDPPDVDGYFENCVWPHHLHYRREIEKDPTVKLLDGMNPHLLEVVLDDLKKMGAKTVS